MIDFERAKTPWWFRLAIPAAIWNMPRSQKQLYLTFDDGPTPGVTDLVLDILESYSAKATFFCLGRQVEKYPKLFDRILSEGHSIGNHSFSHPNGWQTSTAAYLDDVNHGASVLRDHCSFEPRLFRPPYGRLSPSAMMKLMFKFQIVMWDSMSMDYRSDLELATVINNVHSSAKPGSIVLCHDSELAGPFLPGLLQSILDHFSEQQFSFSRLNDGRCDQ